MKQRASKQRLGLRRKRRRRRSPRSRRLRGLGIKVLGLGLMGGILAILLLRWLEAPPKSSANACAIFQEKLGWYGDLRKSERAWGTPKAVQLAILFQESSFRARARPPRKKLFRIIPWRRPSTAYGYGQILDGTWEDYQRRRNRPKARRSSFGDVADFVGWYTDQIHRTTGIPRSDARRLYLAYHEGPGGYSRGSHQSKAWLLTTATRVAQRAERYQRQLDGCESSLWWKHLALRALQALSLVAFLGVLYRILRRRWRSKKKTRRR